MTWADNIIIQAIADTMNLKIYIVESNENFAQITLVEPLNLLHNSRFIFIGCMDEMHYISTVKILSERSSVNLMLTMAKENTMMWQKTKIDNGQVVGLKFNHVPIMHVQMKVQNSNHLLQVLAKKEKYRANKKNC